jgi:Fic-DOC domain mobile mystery protein B
VTDLFQEPEDATPLAPQEREGLRQTWITHRKDLNEAEEANILKGVAWAKRRKLTITSLLTDDFVGALHKRMFGDVWSWAGDYRDSERNIGIPAYEIPMAIRTLLSDALYWVEHQSYEPDEIAVRFHHRLVAIHPFPNGNGRHSRQMADLFIKLMGGEPFSWGGSKLQDTGELRRAYVTALRAADEHDINPLLAFVRS